MMFKEKDGKINLTETEEKIIQFWEERNIFHKTLEIRKNAEPFVFYEGPPTANGRPGIHHVLSRTIKDVVCRFKTMQGRLVHRKAGWDTHGLPVEIEVEKMLGIDGKEGIEEYGVDKFNEKCKESVFNYKTEWDDLTRRIGYWLDLENPYITFHNSYIESVWWILKQLHDRGLIYRGFKILPYCPRCETPLSSHEVSQGYRDVKDPSVFVRFKMKDEPDTAFLVWTTTPWTLISNVALAVHPEVEYVKVAHQGEKLILAEARAAAVFGEDYEVLERFSGRKLQHKKYERLFDFVPVEKEAFYVIPGDFVTTEDGTGIVHIAPAFGEDDYQAGLKYDLPVLRPVDQSGEFEEIVSDYRGRFVKEADPQIIKDLKTRGLLFRRQVVEHSYPHCWRCDTPLLYYARESWYIRTTEFKSNLLKNNKQISWYPPEVGEGRFGEWLNNNVDWSLSRDRYWGTPLNIWVCSECEEQQSIGSIAELREKGMDVPENIDLHKPHVDHIVLKCSSCGGEMKRTPEVIDVWFDSGSMPYAQWHYPFENKERFEKNFPADFICEGVDQTRGWFYSLLAISTMLFDKPAFKNIVVNELILDKDGQKMSKSRGNAVIPENIINRFGADPLRWYFITVSAPWVPKRFDTEGIAEVFRKFFDTLFNVYGFFALYANIDGFDPLGEAVPFEDRPEVDRWILSLLYSRLEFVNNHLQNYDMTRAARAISDFIIDDVSNWYVRRNRRRFWKGEMNSDKQAAYHTLYEVLVTTAGLIAPFVPFTAEEIYQNLKTADMPESVHLTEYPTLTSEMKERQNAGLEQRMQVAQQVVGMARALRNNVRLKVRQPLSTILITSPSKKVRDAAAKMEKIILEEINVKEMKILEKATEVVERKARPLYKNLGPRMGKMMKKVAEIVENLNTESIEHLEANGEITLDVEGTQIHIFIDDVEIYDEKRNEDLVVQREDNILIALDTRITPELKKEGIAREFVNRIQNLRKEAGFEVMDRIHIYYNASQDLSKAIQEMSDYIQTETLAKEVKDVLQDEGDIKQDIQIDGENFPVSLKKV
ncbi:MAG: isoleucine--tRNA ligase [Calditrichia bacterium]